MALSKGQAETVLADMVKKISQLFYNGGKFMVLGTYEVVPRIVMESGALPNGNLAPLNAGQMGVQVTNGLLSMSDDTAVKFALGHELGHGFSESALTKIGLHGADGCVTEIIADLGSAYVLNLLGTGWPAIVSTTTAGIKLGIFDVKWSGDHPPGSIRADAVRSLSELMTGGEDFDTAALAICLSMKGFHA